MQSEFLNTGVLMAKTQAVIASVKSAAQYYAAENYTNLAIAAIEKELLRRMRQDKRRKGRYTGLKFEFDQTKKIKTTCNFLRYALKAKEAIYA